MAVNDTTIIILPNGVAVNLASASRESLEVAAESCEQCADEWNSHATSLYQALADRFWSKARRGKA